MDDITIRIEAFENRTDLDGTRAKTSEFGSDVDFVQVEEPDPLNIKFAFNPKSGVLSLIRAPDDIIQATGFLTQKSLGTGVRGKKGKRGADGRDGKTGYDGRDGKTGCPGIQGVKGKKGLPGRDADDGPVGPVGKSGCGGAEGEDGEKGNKGIIGHEGSQGLMGSSCKQGPDGPEGEKPLEIVLFSDVPPIDNLLAYIWAKPVNRDQVDPTNPLPPIDTPSPLNGRVDSLAMNVPPVGAGWYQAILYFKVNSLSGGVGPFNYKWSGDFSSNANLSVVDTGMTAANLNLKCRIYIAGTETRKITGGIRCTVTDVGNGNNPLLLDATYTFNIVATASGGGDDGGGGSGGCIVFGQHVNLVNGEQIQVQSILHGDSLIGASIETLPDSSNGNSKFLDWFTSDLKSKNTNVTAMSVKHGTYHSYYKINNILKITLEENMLCLRGGYWSFKRVKDLRVGDYLYHRTEGAKEIFSIEQISEQVKTVSLDVETADTYYVEDYLVHNLDAGGPVIKH